MDCDISPLSTRTLQFENLTIDDNGERELYNLKIYLSRVVKCHNPLVAGENVSLLTKTSKIFLRCR